MSETTNKMRDVAIYSDSLIRVRDLTADAIEAVEAQVAEAAKRHEDLAAWCAETEARVAALEKRQGKDGAQVASSGCASVPVAVAPESTASPAAPVRRFLPGDRVRVAKDTRWGSGYLSKLGTIESLTDPTGAWDYVVRMDEMGYAGPHPLANDADLEPAPSAVPAPRGFRVGDVVRHREFPGEDWTVSKVMEGGGLIHCTRPRGWVFRAESCNLALVRAADAPEAPAEVPTTRPTPAMELDALRGEVARLTAERDDWKYAAEVQKKDTEGWKARAEAAEKERDEVRAISAATAERARSETQSATELRHELDDLRAKLAAAEKALDVERRTMVMCPDGVTPTRRVVDSVEARERAVAEFAREEIDRKNELNALRAELSALKAKPRFRTRKVTAADARALDDEWAKSKYVGRNSWVLAMNALGFRRRVDGAK